MRSTSKLRILVWSLGLLVVLLIPGTAVAASNGSHGDPSTQLASKLNNARVQRGLQPLTRAAGLDQIAAARSQDMANGHYFNHTTPGGATVLKSLRSQGIGFRKAGEVIAKIEYSGDQSAAIACESLLNSPEHRAVILDPNYTQFGVGEATDGNGMHIFTGVYVQR